MNVVGLFFYLCPMLDCAAIRESIDGDAADHELEVSRTHVSVSETGKRTNFRQLCLPTIHMA